MKKLYTTLLMVVFGITATAQTIVYVNDDATGNNNGTSWADAYTDLNDALVNTISIGSEIWIAEGFYTRTSKNESFDVSNDFLLYGGFAGTETNIDQRDIANHPTIISGDVGWNDTGAPSSSNSSMFYNSSHVFRIYSNNRALFDGLIIERAFSTTESGGGINVISSSLENLQISNCIIRENVAKNRAGVLYSSNANASGFYMFNNRIEDNVNTDGTTSYTIEFRASNPNWMYADVHFVNNLFKNNSSESPFQIGTIARFATEGSSGIDLFLTNNTFVDNPQTGYNVDNVASLIVYEHISGAGNLNAFLNNNIFYNNTGVTDIFGESMQGSSLTGQLNVANTSSNQNVQDFLDNFTLLNTHVITTSPFVNYANGDYTPIAAYQTIGDTTYYDGQYLNNSYYGQDYPTTDLAGNPRFDSQGNIDIGAYQAIGSVSISDIEKNNNINYYPNPFNNIVMFSLNDFYKKINITVRDITGKVVLEKIENLTNSQFSLDLSDHSAGVYFVQIGSEKSLIETIKLIKE